MDPRELVGQVVRGLKSLQVSGQTRLDGGLIVNGPTSVNGIGVDGLLDPAIEGNGRNIPNLALALPRLARSLQIEIEAISDQAVAQGLFITFNSDAAAHYYWSGWQVNGAGPAFAGLGGGAPANSIRCGMLGNNAMAAGMTPYTQISIGNADSTTQRKTLHYRSMQWPTDALANANSEYGQGMWTNTTDPIRSLNVTPGAGLFAYIRLRVYVLS